MTDIDIRIVGQAGRITLTRPQALNALTYDMCTAFETALDNWRDDESVTLIVLDASGDRAFCAGGDIADLYAEGRKGNFAYGQAFWADEYRLNHKIFTYPKPIVSFLHGFIMGGGVGIGCHGSHRIVGETSQIALPECGIGLVPDVGSTCLLALAPGRLGEYLGITGSRMNAADAIFADFADHYIPQSMWIELIHSLEQSGDPTCLSTAAHAAENPTLEPHLDQINALFAGERLNDILTLLHADPSDLAVDALKKISRTAPLSSACTVEMLHRLRGPSLSMEKALELEYRFTYRASEHADFLEGIRAAIIDKDRAPKWQFSDTDVPLAAVSKMLQPLGPNTLKL
ncbi:MAG: enoyl-CoA hydratase/isomerase family protein [Sulfitobacter sp.]